jgi:hypothetical protein
VYRALAGAQLSLVPRLLGAWADPEAYPFPFAAVTRLPGTVPAEPEALADQLGRAIAGWHEAEPPALAGARPPGHQDAAPQRWLRAALDPASSATAAAQAAARLSRPDRAGAWADLLARAAALEPVLVHGDLHENQLLARDGRLTGVIDWETARSITRSGTSTSASGAPGCGAAVAATSAPCGRGGGGRTRSPAGWIRTPARWRPPSGSGRRSACSPTPAIPRSWGPSRSTSR